MLLALKAATHHMLYLRQVYPERYFQHERVLGTATKACRHAAVRAYVSEVLDSVKVVPRPRSELHRMHMAMSGICTHA